MKLKDIEWKPFIISLVISFGAAAISRLFTPDSAAIYASLPKPPFAPPSWLFPIIWTILYFLMGVSSYRIYTSASPFRIPALKNYIAQLIANVLWSAFFFGLNTYILAFSWLVLLWYLVYCTIKSFLHIDEFAGKLLIPYLIWITFAGYLNLYIAIKTI